MTKVLPSHTHKFLCNQLLHTLRGDEVFKFDGSCINGIWPKVCKDVLSMPDLSRYVAEEPSDISDCQTEEVMKNKFGTRSTDKTDLAGSVGHADCMVTDRMFRCAANYTFARIASAAFKFSDVMMADAKGI